MGKILKIGKALYEIDDQTKNILVLWKKSR